jgi:hypothetical protein
LKATVFSEGIGSFQMELPGGKSAYRLVDAEGKFIRVPGGKAFLEFDHPLKFSADGTAIASKNGAYGIVDRAGNEIVKHEYQFLQDFGETRKIAEKNGDYFLLEKDKSGIWQENRTNQFDFMTEPQEGVSVGFRLSSENKELRYLIREDGSVVSLRGRFEFVDDFTDEGIAAVRYKRRGKTFWGVIDGEGKFVEISETKAGKVTTFKDVEASNAAEVLERYRQEKTVAERNAEMFADSALFRDARKLAIRFGMKADKVAPTNVKGIFAVMEEGKKGFINVNTGAVLKNEFEDMIYNDAKHGFLRVKKGGKWGVYNAETGKAEFDMEARNYASIQIQSMRLGLFEVETDTGKRGLIARAGGEVKLKPEYAYIENPSPGVYQGINFETLADGSTREVVGETVHTSAEGLQASSTKFDPIEGLLKTNETVHHARRSLNAVTELDIRNTSEPVRELLDAGLPSVMSGLRGLRGLNFPTFEAYSSAMPGSTEFATFAGFRASIGSQAQFQNYVRSLFSAYRKAYAAEGHTLSKAESVHIETVVVPYYTREFERYAMLRSLSSPGLKVPKVTFEAPAAANDEFFSSATKKTVNFR